MYDLLEAVALAVAVVLLCHRPLPVPVPVSGPPAAPSMLNLGSA